MTEDNRRTIIYSGNHATKRVAGRRHLIGCNDRRALIDGGLFQRSSVVESAHAEPFGFDHGAIHVLPLARASAPLRTRSDACLLTVEALRELLAKMKQRPRHPANWMDNERLCPA